MLIYQGKRTLSRIKIKNFYVSEKKSISSAESGDAAAVDGLDGPDGLDGQNAEGTARCNRIESLIPGNRDSLHIAS